MKKKTQNKTIRFITATTLFDGHDASINIIRRLLQQAGAEVVHLGHNRSVREIVDTAIQEGVHALCLSSYQGGHMEFFKYVKDLLRENNADFIKIFGGGGGVIVPGEIKELEDYGIARIYSPEDGQKLGLAGIIDDMMERASEVEMPPLPENWKEKLRDQNSFLITQLISIAEREYKDKKIIYSTIGKDIRALSAGTPVIGITGTGGSGKSSLEDEFIRRFARLYPEKKIALLAIDPTRKKTGGALLGDRLRMNFISPDNIYMRSLATRTSKSELTIAIKDSLAILKAAAFDLIIVETPGIGQGDTGITDFCDISIYVMTSDFGSPTQLEKIDMLDYADIIVINKFDHKRSMDTMRDVRAQYRRNHNDFTSSDQGLPIVGTVASNFNDEGLDVFFETTLSLMKEKGLIGWTVPEIESYSPAVSSRLGIIPNEREYYLSEITGAVRSYHDRTEREAEKLKLLEAYKTVRKRNGQDGLDEKIEELEGSIDHEIRELLKKWEKAKKEYSEDTMVTRAGGKETVNRLSFQSLTGLNIPKVILPEFSASDALLRWLRRENLPGHFPFTAGVFPFRREGEEPKRQFAGEGSPERTNKRFHYLSLQDDAKRLSTAFDSVTLYGRDPSEEPDIFGKIGESGVSVCTLDDVKELYAGFDLSSPKTSVSMTINGPAPVMLAFFFNTAIDREAEKFMERSGRKPTEEERDRIKKDLLTKIRGTVQADILKEDQGQNSCIFSTDFGLKMMGDIQEYFIENRVKNFYSVSISGYHIAEAGANPITQLAFTLSNAFTYVEYYLSRGMNIDDFAPNLSFFFSTGMDPEYNVIIRVARRIWAIAMKYRYGANEQSQRLKCHVQTSGRSLHAQEIQFNDIRTTLQALMALNDNCNSLHTNSYDEAITTPTEESVRRAMAIQLIITREYGFHGNQNSNQGSFIIDWLTRRVEESVLREFEYISQRGGVLGAMESHYQRGKIQDESLYYEFRKDSGDYPIIGVNTYINPQVLREDYERPPVILTRATVKEKKSQYVKLKKFQNKNRKKAEEALENLRKTALEGGNIFAELMNTARYASLGQITELLYEVGGKYRRNI
jgi:methylmalonyl-CoA mutase